MPLGLSALFTMDPISECVLGSPYLSRFEMLEDGHTSNPATGWPLLISRVSMRGTPRGGI